MKVKVEVQIVRVTMRGIAVTEERPGVANTYDIGLLRRHHAAQQRATDYRLSGRRLCVPSSV